MSAGNNLNSYFHVNSKDTMPLGGVVVVVGSVSCALFAQKKLMAKNTMKIHFYSVKKSCVPTAPRVPRRSPIQVLTRLDAA